MALAIDNKDLLDVVLPDLELIYNSRFANLVDGSRGPRLQLLRVCVYATVTHADSLMSMPSMYESRHRDTPPRLQAALDWQAEQDVDEDEVEVLHHLKQVAATTRTSKARTTTLVASAQSPIFTSLTQHRPPSSVRRCSIRHRADGYFNETVGFGCNFTDMKKLIPNSHEQSRFSVSCHWLPRIVSTGTEALGHDRVRWLLQLDFFELSSQSPYSASSPGKSRRTLDPFHHISPRRDEDRTARAHDRPPPEAVVFKGVRNRLDHKRFVAEMKPPGHRNKVSFGEFRYQTDAARVVDIAFYHFDRLPLNFPDSTPHIMSLLQPSTGLSVEAKLKLVRDQIEWMKSRPPPEVPRCPDSILSLLRPSAGLSVEAQLKLVRDQIEWEKSRVSSPPPEVPRFCSPSEIASSLVIPGRDEGDAIFQLMVASDSALGIDAAVLTEGVFDGCEDATQLFEEDGMPGIPTDGVGQASWMDFHRLSPSSHLWSPGPESSGGGV